MTFRGPRSESERRRFAAHVQRPKDLQKQCDDWNAKHPVGTEVEVLKDNGTIERTKTRSKAYVMSEHTAVIFLDGISGCYLLSRCRPSSTATETR